jgi:hypothetical protein
VETTGGGAAAIFSGNVSSFLLLYVSGTAEEEFNARAQRCQGAKRRILPLRLCTFASLR